MKRALLVIAVVLASAAFAAAVFAHRLLYTEQGLQFIVSRLAAVPGVSIEIEGARGTLAESLSAERVVVDHEAVRIELNGLRATPELGALLAGHLELAELVVDSVDVKLREREASPAADIHFLPRFLTIHAQSVRVGPIGVTLASGQHLGVASASAEARVTRWRIEVSDLHLQDPDGQLNGTLALRASTPLGVKSELNGRWRLPDGHDYEFRGRTSGKLDRLAVNLALAAPARLSYAGNLLADGESYRTVGVLRAEEFDGSPWLPSGSIPPLSGSVALDLAPLAFGLDGTVDSTLFGDGPLRLQGGGRFRDGGIELSGLRLWLPRLAAEFITWGRIGLGEGAPMLDLQGEWTALQWPLAESAIVDSPYGQLRLRGQLPYDYEIDGYLRPKDLPTATLKARGAIDRSELRVDALDGRVMEGTVRGSGRFAWEGEGKWDLRVEGRSLDLSQLRSDLSGRLDIAGHAAGAGLGQDGPWAAQIDRFSGSLLGRPLTGHGRVAYEAGYYTLAGVRLTSGESHVDLGGRWGPDVDLEWNADLASLAIVAPDLRGSLLTSGRIHGPQARPEIAAELRAKNLVYGSLRAESAEASADLDLADGRSSRVDATLRGSSTGTLEFDAVTLRGEGLMADHRFRIEVSSTGTADGRVAGFDAFLSASGLTDISNRRWTGTLEQARAEFPDGRAELMQPVALTVSADRLESAPICLANEDARLCFEGNWQREPEAWQGFFSAQDWPLRRLLRNLFGWREFDGRLQASGWIAKEPGRDWIGAATLLLDDPTLDIPRNKFRSERIELGGGRLDLFADVAGLRGNLDLTLVEGTTVQGQVAATRIPGEPLAQSPLTGEIRSESTALNALPLLVPEIDRAAGRLDASLRIGGTLGSPQLTGEFRVFEGRFDMYRTNLSLRDVTLDGRFVGDELSFEGSAGTGKGPLSLEGRFGWPDGIMTGSMRMWGSELLVADTPEYRVFASPDLVLRAGPEGYEVEGTVEIPRARISPKDLSGSVQTSADERVVGIDAEDASPSTLDRVRSRIRVVLGDDVRVDSYGLKASLGGDVTVSSRPDDVPRATGAIDVIEGEYKAFGQFVKITKGRLTYDNTPLDDPSLEIVAEREIKDEDIVVAVNVRGKLAEPFVTLSSTPAMPSNRALSYLLTGRSIDTLQSNQAGSIDRAAESLAISGGGMLLGAVGRRIGLDEVAVESRGANDTEVVLGKYISPKLFVSYGISIAEAINTIKLRYTINRKWSLKAEAGLEQSADVEYKLER